MRNFTLSQAEICGINLFMSDVVTIPMVEAVYLIPFVSSKDGTSKCDVVTIYNSSLYYNGLLTGEERYRDTSDEKNTIDEVMDIYAAFLKNSRVSFRKETSSNYDLSMMHIRELMAERSLVSGNILFDRFGKIKENRDRAVQLLSPFLDSMEVSNIEKVLDRKTPAVEYMKENN